MDSILLSIKKLLGYDADYTAFDADIVMCINTALNILTQLGVGPEEGFSIEDETAVWSDFLPDMSKYHMVKSYVHQKVRMLFDSSTMNSALINEINKQLGELEFRLNVEGDKG